MKRAEVSTPSDTEVRVERRFNASAELVWQAYTKPELLKRWMLGPPGWSMPICEMDARVGGAYRWRWRNDQDGKEFGFFGTFQEVEPCTRIVHTEYYDPGDLNDSMGQEDSPMIVSVDFKEVDGGTMMCTTMKCASMADRDAALSTGMTDGMEMSYQLLDKVLETQSAGRN